MWARITCIIYTVYPETIYVSKSYELIALLRVVGNASQSWGDTCQKYVIKDSTDGGGSLSGCHVGDRLWLMLSVGIELLSVGHKSLPTLRFMGHFDLPIKLGTCQQIKF